ncbi:MAG: 3D domain-containing protein [Sedimentisphaerales bacterium]|nr:3D domain-containing protein [Sedimentisphaerales bacterium]
MRWTQDEKCSTDRDRQVQSPVSAPRLLFGMVLGMAASLMIVWSLGLDVSILADKIIPLSRPVEGFGATATTITDREAQALARLEESIERGIPEISQNQYEQEEVIGEDAEWRTVRMRVTAYCPCRICCGKNSDGKTACMHKIKLGDTFVAADKMFSFGTEMIIPGYNNNEPVEVLDRGRLIKGYRLDVFFNSHAAAQKWGTKYLDVKVKK